MIEKINETKYGCVEYFVGDISEIDLLPKKGIKSGSTAQLLNENGLRVFMFKRPSKDSVGTWIEI